MNTLFETIKGLVIRGRIPSKKNSVIAMVRGGRVIHIPSNQYRAWHKDASQQLLTQNDSLIPFGKNLHIKLFAPDARKSDMTNKTESLMDFLVDNGLLVDDNWFEVEKLFLEFGGIDRDNPRAEIQNLCTTCKHCGKETL